jgi:hypothetical protein
LNDYDLDSTKKDEHAEPTLLTGEPLLVSGGDPVTTTAHTKQHHESDQVNPQMPFRFSDFAANKEAEAQGTGLAVSSSSASSVEPGEIDR